MARCPVLTILTALLLLATARIAPAPVAAPFHPEDAFAVSGNDALADDDILGALGRAACTGVDSVCLKAMCDSVAYLYWSLGYIDVRVTCTKGGAGQPVELTLSREK